MSQKSVHNTNVDVIQQQVESLLEDCKKIVDNNEDLSHHKYRLERKYNYLFQTSSALFKYIVNQYGTDRFDQTTLDNNLNMMLAAIRRIQESKVTQYDASAEVGDFLAQQYIPQYKDLNKENTEGAD